MEGFLIPTLKIMSGQANSSNTRNLNLSGALFIYVRSVKNMSQNRICRHFPLVKYVTIDTHKSNKENISDDDNNRIEYHIINVGNPKSRFCHESGCELQQFDRNTKERA